MRIQHALRSTVMLSALVLALSPFELQAGTIPISYYQFTGTCTQCTGPADGLLMLQDYVPGDPITADNFLSFSYTSNLFAVVIPSASAAGALAGSISDTPGPSFVEIGDAANEFLLISTSAGFWCAGPSCNGNSGAVSSWAEVSGTPEPATFLPVAAAILGLGFYRRRELLAFTVRR